eukprot:gnl/TRDRNA2_/TRDRNA2_148367_c1_seq2.p1 gnl/TRDRNA2_/TRDRNA2_148367_c1~~gnl/TRDRNA2_/TRDRNA2_148367_c1_seq2.p1  ORF type:complete len:177 (+),score=30.79 gnl/TRDRNA2_/TRDRNA2_148367_c1_seq2:94-624(+)
MLHQVCLSDAARLASQLRGARQVFVGGAGRSGFAMRGFAMRLMHLGFVTHFVGEVSNPPIGMNDLLLLGSGSGRTGSLVMHAQRARDAGATVALITIDKQSPIALVASQTGGVTLALDAPSPKISDGPAVPVVSVQPMGTLFEQALSVTCDAVVMLLMEETGQSSEDMFRRHANLE